MRAGSLLKAAVFVFSIAAPIGCGSLEDSSGTEEPIVGEGPTTSLRWPPEALLVVGGEEIEAAEGSYCTPDLLCVEKAPLEAAYDPLITTGLLVERGVAVVLSEPVVSFDAAVRDPIPRGAAIAADSDDLLLRALYSERGESQDGGTAFVLDPLKHEEQILEVDVSFERGGDASYLWWLRPPAQAEPEGEASAEPTTSP